jgi:capsular polysaccharide transport system permease protein
MSVSGGSRVSRLAHELRAHGRVVQAILVRDMQTRFGRSHISYLVAIGWPLSHLLGIVVSFSVVNRMLPFGTDSVMFISTGALPYILCLYPARMMSMGLLQNMGTMSFPIVAPFHVIVARFIVEGLTAFAVVIVFVFGLWAVDSEIVPNDAHMALLAVYASVFFGLSIGSLGMLLRSLAKTPGYVLMIMALIGMYLASGVMVPMHPSSETLRTLLGYNPIYQLVLWTRSAYFETHSVVPLDRWYVVLLSLILLTIALAGERLFRGKIMTP